MKQKTLSFICLLLTTISLSASATTFNVGGINYDIISEEEQTVQVGDNSGFSGDAVIPESVEYGGKQYAVTAIGSFAFNGCSGLTSVTIPNSITSIGQQAFYKCKVLTSVTIPASVTSIGGGAFEYCSHLTTVKVTVINKSAFCNNKIGPQVYSALYWNNFFLEKTDIPVMLIDKNGEEIKDFVIPNDVTAIGAYAFINCGGLTSVTIPVSVNNIGKRAFSCCDNLSTVKLSIDDKNAFLNNRVAAQIRDATGHIEYYMNEEYEECTRVIPNDFKLILFDESGEEIKDFVIPNDITSIDNAFPNCSGLTSVTIPNSITTIGSNAFYGCSGLTSVNIPNSVTSIGNRAFCGCSGLTSVNIPNSVSYIGWGAFEKCSGLTSVNIPNSVTSIGNRAFCGCSGLTSVTIPNSITSIGECAFEGCSSLTSVTIPNSVTFIGTYAFSGCSGLTSVTIPNSVTSISDNAFTGCDNLNSVVLHCPSIGNCFQGLSSIQEVFLGEEVSSISGSAFNGCSGLTSVTSKIVSPFAIQSGAFGGVYPECILTVPKGMVSDYADNGWNQFGGGIIDESIRCIDGIYYALDSSKKTASVTNRYGYDGDSDYSWLKASYADTLDIPNVVTYDGEQYSVTFIGKNALRKCNDLTAVYLPDGLTDAATLKDLQAKIYVNRGTTTLLALWTIGMEPYEKNTDIVLTAPKFDIATTQTTATLKATPVYPEYTYAYNDMIPLGEEGIRWTGLYPEYSEEVTLNVMLGTQCYESKQTFTTQSLAPKVIASQRTASSITFKGIYTEGDADVDDEHTLTVDGENILGDTKTLTGLEPNTGYTAYFTVRVHYGDNGQYTKSYTGTSTLQTESISFTTMPAKIITADDVIVSSAVNLNDAETTAGFEWRVAGGDEDLFESKYGQAYLYEGMMEGTIHKLNPNYLWKFRPYYQSANGYYYYGNWKGIDLSDNQSYFEPTVHTYAGVEMGDGTATVSGYAQRGSDEIAEEGFEYWEESGNTSDAPLHAPAYANIPDDAMKVLADGTLMQAQLTGLTPNSTYGYVAFVRTTKGKTYYGVVRQFTTGKHQQATSVEAFNAKQAPTNEAIYDLLGRKHDNLHKGVNIIRMEDGSTRKVYVK